MCKTGNSNVWGRASNSVATNGDLIGEDVDRISQMEEEIFPYDMESLQ